MHIEFHDSACPRVDVDVGVVGVGDREERIVGVLAGIIQGFGHTNQVASDDCS